jgi:phosphoribosylaminoimidazole carboxylase
MVNILGDEAGAAGEAKAIAMLSRSLAVAGASAHWYGKAGCRAGRKMGHITIVADNAAQLQERLDAVVGRK